MGGLPSQNELWSRVTFFHQISRCFLGACFLKPRITFFANNVKKWPQKGPKRTTQTIKFTDVRPLKTYGIYNTDHTFCSFGCALGSIFFHTVLRTLFFHHFFAFWEIRCQNSPKNGRVFYAENLTNSALSPKSSHEAPRRAQGLPNDAKMLPKGPKMMPPGPLKLKLYTHSHATQSRNEQTHNSRLLARWRLIAQRIG